MCLPLPLFLFLQYFITSVEVRGRLTDISFILLQCEAQKSLKELQENTSKQIEVLKHSFGRTMIK